MPKKPKKVSMPDMTEDEVKLGMKAHHHSEHMAMVLGVLCQMFSDHVDDMEKKGVMLGQGRAPSPSSPEGIAKMERFINGWTPFLAWIGVSYFKLAMDAIEKHQELMIEMDEELQKTVPAARKTQH
tara:strand:- start:603 stop:980 length:378 start_codon:yes stop_codon:yes gene_type:complete